MKRSRKRQTPAIDHRVLEAPRSCSVRLHLEWPISAVGGDRIRTAEVMAATCLATDLGMGFPFEHGLHATLMAMRLADLVGGR